MRSLGVPRSGEESLPRRRLWRWVWRIAACVGAVIALLVVALAVVLHSLDRPWLKRRIQAIVRTSAGVEIDYRAARLSVLSGIEVDGLVVRSPLELRAIAPELARVGRIDARWHAGSLLGHGPVLDQVTISDVTLTVTVDEHGRTSFDALPSTGTSSPPAAPVPLSQQASSALGTALPVGAIDLRGVELILIRTKEGEVAERTELEGLAATVFTMSAGPAEKGWRARAALGSPAAPLALVLTRTRRGEKGQEEQTASARAKLWLTADATSSAVTAALDLRMGDQTFAPSVAIGHWLHAEARARFDPAAKSTFVTVDHTEAGDGAAHAEASLEIPDTGDPLVRRAQGDADLARLLRWVPPGLVPVTAERAQVRYHLESLAGAAVPHLLAGGSAALDADWSNVRVELGGGPLHLSDGKVSIHAQPAEGGGIAGSGSISIVGLELATAGNHLAADALALDFDGRQGADGVVDGHAGVRFRRIAADGASPIVAQDGHLEMQVAKLRPGASDPLATQGDLTLSFDVGSLDLRSAGMRVIGEGLSVHAHTRLEGHAPYALELDIPVARLRVLGRDGAPLADTPARFKATAHDVVPDLARPEASRGGARATVDLGETRLSLDATKGADSLDFALGADTPSLKALRPFLSATLAKQAPWDQIGVALRSSGHADHLGGGAPSIQQTTQLDVQRPAFENVAARSLSLTLRSKGTSLKHEADADLHVSGLAFGGNAPGDEHVTVSAAMNREHPSLRFELATEGRAATQISGSASFDPARRAVPYEIEAHLGGLAPLAPFLAKVHGLDGFDVSQLDLGLSARGALLGVVAGIGRDGTVQLEPHPSRTAGIEGRTDLRVGQLHWSHGDNAVIAPAVVWRGEMHLAGARRTVESHLEIDALHLDLGPKDVDLTKVRDDSSVTVSGDLLDPETGITQRTSIGSVKQDFVPEYPIGDVSFAVTAERDREGLIHVADLKLANEAGGTKLGLTGNFELSTARRTLSVTTSFTQDLARLATIPARFTGHGQLGLDATVTSPDLALFRVRATLKGEDVSLELPRARVELDTFNGQVPITVALEVGKNGVALRPDEKRSHYSMLRFADQHPLLSRSGFLSIASLKTPFVTIAPLVGNLEIEQNFVSLRQFEMGVRKGSITGQCGLDWEGPKSTLELHVRASGVQSSHGEPFDGNIAVVIAAGDRTVEGRAEILHIGERHLLDLLDMQDPLHVDPAMNRVRTALLVGYPDRLRLVFDHGFASARLELGGLARLISIGELRGIPMGPIVDKFLAPVLDAHVTSETSDASGDAGANGANGASGTSGAREAR